MSASAKPVSRERKLTLRRFDVGSIFMAKVEAATLAGRYRT